MYKTGVYMGIRYQITGNGCPTKTLTLPKEFPTECEHLHGTPAKYTRPSRTNTYNSEPKGLGP